ncbi:MAG TPA: thioredoxin domain-containing protein, partial [Povalibacter sp.]|nr:thioredoxin domain-containing protein [Povalibacter sp.]
MNISLPSRARMLLAIVACALALSAPSQAEPVEGRDYARLVPPQVPDTQGKTEVIEFFSYGCPHCNAFNPMITEWAKQLPANVTFIRVPVSLGRQEWGQLV